MLILEDAESNTTPARKGGYTLWVPIKGSAAIEPAEAVVPIAEGEVQAADVRTASPEHGIADGHGGVGGLRRGRRHGSDGRRREG